MPDPKPDGPLPASSVSPDDVIRLFGDLDTQTLIAILALQPTIADLEEAALRSVGNGEAVGGRQASGVVAEILDLIDTGDEEPGAPAPGPRIP